VASCHLTEGDHVCIGIETLDDVVFETDGFAVDVLQGKRHINAHSSLVIRYRSANFIGDGL